MVGDPDLHEPVDAFTLMHHDLDVCTNSLQVLNPKLFNFNFKLFIFLTFLVCYDLGYC